MGKTEKTDNVKCSERQEAITYRIDKKEFIVNPIYRKSGETIREILLKLMEREAEKP